MARRIDEKRIHDFIELIDKLPDVITAYEINKTSLANFIGLTRPTLNTKIKNKSFTASEMLKVAKFINR